MKLRRYAARCLVAAGAGVLLALAAGQLMMTIAGQWSVG